MFHSFLLLYSVELQRFQQTRAATEHRSGRGRIPCPRRRSPCDCEKYCRDGSRFARKMAPRILSPLTLTGVFHPFARRDLTRRATGNITGSGARGETSCKYPPTPARIYSRYAFAEYCHDRAAANDSRDAIRNVLRTVRGLARGECLGATCISAWQPCSHSFGLPERRTPSSGRKLAPESFFDRTFTDSILYAGVSPSRR